MVKNDQHSKSISYLAYNSYMFYVNKIEDSPKYNMVWIMLCLVRLKTFPMNNRSTEFAIFLFSYP